jgi:integrase
MAAHYYDVKKADGCSALFLNAIRKHLQRFLDWLKSKGFDVCKNTAEDLTSALLSGYRQSLAEDASIARKTANHYIDHVRMLLLWGAKVHGIHHPPLGSIQQFSGRRNAKAGHGRKQDRTPLTWDQLEKLLLAADVTDSALIMLGLNCGFGNSDIGKLKLCDVDLENASVSHPRPKTGVHRDFALWPETVHILKAYLAGHRGRPLCSEAEHLFFVSRKGQPLSWHRLNGDGKLARSDAVKNRFDRLCKKAGIKRKYGVGFYILRHTYATLIGENSNDFREVQAALGQLTIQQQEAYRHDRKIKAFNAQQRLRCDMKESSIPKILHDKLSVYSA